MLKFSQIKYTTKLFISMILVVIVSLVITSGVAINLSKEGLYSLGEGAIKDVHQSLDNSLNTIIETSRKKLDGDLTLLDKKVHSQGGLLLDDMNMVDHPLIDPGSGAVSTINIPKFQAGVSWITGDFTFVDSISKSTGSSATIFQLVGDKMVRVSTNVKKKDGSRAIGTYITTDSPVYQALMRGETYRGKAFVVTDWFLTTYKPLYDYEKKIIGAIYVGMPMLTERIKKLILGTKIGPGYFFAYSENGTFLVHPSLGSDKNLFTLVPQFKDQKHGFVRYNWKGQEKVTYTKFLDSVGIYLAVGLNRADIVGGLDAKMMRTNILVGLLVVAGGILVAFLLVRSINKPLKELAEKAEKVGEGDYTIEFTSTVNDAIGQLSRSLGVMVEKGREMMGDIVTSSKEMSDSSATLAGISDLMVNTAESTAVITGETSGNAQSVSDNMGSVSAAMEQSTVNLDMIATASEEMGNTIQEIAENSARARQTTEEAVQNTKRSHDSIMELGEAAKAIGSITETITEISEQTNLLALNATIEAARAGEAGKGFAVVANEIKDLAKGTAEATGKIKDAIAGIQDKTGETVQDIETITKVIGEVNEIVTTIVTAVEEQSITTREIVSNVSQASQGITEINQNVALSNQMTEEMSSRVAQVSEHAIEVKENSLNVRSSADDLSQLAERLNVLVAKFKI